METPTIQVGGIIRISLGAIKETTSGDHKHHQDLETEYATTSTSISTRQRFIFWKFNGEQDGEIHGCDVIKDELAR